MKYISFFLLIFIGFKSIAQTKTMLLGSFPSFRNNSFRIVANQNSLNDYQGTILASGKVSDKGLISVPIPVKFEQAVILFIDRIFLKLWIIPGTSLNINEEVSNGYSFSGVAANHNRFLLQAGIMMSYTVPTVIPSIDFQPVMQKAYLDSIERTRNLLFKEIFASNAAGAVFESYCKAEINSFTCYNMNQYPMLYIFAKKTLKQKDIPSSYYNFWDHFKLADDSCQSDSYNNAVRDFIGYKVSEKLGFDISDMEKYQNENFRLMDSLLKDHPFTLEKQKTEALLFSIRYLDQPDLVNKEIDLFKKRFPKSKALHIIEGEWSKKNAVQSTKPSFQLKDKNGNWVNIQQFKGKVVYIDFWGSWCKPCMEQMSHSTKLQEQFKGKDIVFLFIDFYDTKEKWLSTISNRKLGGIHVKAEKKDETYFNSVFGIGQGFPRYALINKEGVLVTTSAPHPNNDKIGEFLLGFLN